MVRSSTYFYEPRNHQITFPGVTFVYGEENDFANLETTMSSLNATRLTPTDPFATWYSYKTGEPPFVVLNRLENHGYKVVAAIVNKDGWIMWTLQLQ